MNIVDLLEKNARLYPHDTAFVEIRPLSTNRSETSWQIFHQRTNRLANALSNRGVQKGQTVFLLGRNSLRWLECYFGVLKTGAWIVPLNFRFTDQDIRYCAQIACPVAFFFDEEYAARIQTLKDSLNSVKQYVCLQETDRSSSASLETTMVEGAEESPGLPIVDQRTCALYFTSGTTGQPKPVCISHRNLFCTALTEGHNNQIQHQDSLLMMPPLYHLAIGHLLGVLIKGGKTVLLTERISPQFILETIQSEKITYVFLLVPWALDLLEALEKKEIIPENYDLSSWRFTQMGAQPIPASIPRRLKAIFPHMCFDATYGLSESAGPGVIHLGVENEHEEGATGKESLSWSARIVDMEGSDVETGQVGELILKGDGVMNGYYQNPKLTDETIKEGWLHTGDLAKRDKKGFIYLVDRKKDLIISGGENIYPAEVEEVIIQYSGIYDVAVIGTPDERMGEIVTAVIQRQSGATLNEADILEFCEKNLPRYKRPRFIIFDQVPRSLTGKIEKTKLREKYC